MTALIHRLAPSLVSTLSKIGHSTDLSSLSDCFLLALKRHLYVLGAQNFDGKCAQLKILNRFEFEGLVKFAVLGSNADVKQDLIAISHDQEKLVKFYALDSMLAATDPATNMPSIEPLYI